MERMQKRKFKEKEKLEEDKKEKEKNQEWEREWSGSPTLLVMENSGKRDREKKDGKKKGNSGGRERDRGRKM